MTEADAPSDEERNPAFRAAFRATQQPFLVVGGDLVVQFGNPAFYAHFRTEPASVDGQPLQALDDGQWAAAGVTDVVERVAATGEPIDGHRIDRDFARLGKRIVTVDADWMEMTGRRSAVLLAFKDVTENEARLELEEKLLDAVREGLIVLDIDLTVLRANQSFYELFQVPREETEGQPIFRLGNGQWDIPELRRLLEEMIPENSSFDDYEVVHEFEGLGERIMLLNARRIDHLDMILLAIRDVTRERRTEQEQELLLGELQHRVKNILNNVRALLHQSRKSSESVEEFVEAFGGRIQSLSRLQDLLIRGIGRQVRLRELLELELEARGFEESPAIDVEGPPVMLEAREAQSLAMAIHELTTNAVKYGALSDGGRLSVRWDVEAAGAGKTLRLVWREEGVAMDSVPRREGFGREVIEKGLPYMLGGTSAVIFGDNGVRCEISFPLEAPAAPDGVNPQAAP